MSIEVAGVNQTWTQPSTLLPISSASPPIESLIPSPTSATTSPSPSIPQTQQKANNNNIGITPTTSPQSSPNRVDCTTITDRNSEHPSDFQPIGTNFDSTRTTNVEDDQERQQQQLQLSSTNDVVQQQLSVTLPPLPDLIPIRKAQQQQQQGIETNTISCCVNTNVNNNNNNQSQSSPAATTTTASSQILSDSSKTPVDNDDQDTRDANDTRDTNDVNNDHDDDEEEEDDPQHSAFEDATTTSVFTTSTGLDNQTIMYHDGNSNMSQQNSTMPPADQILNPESSACVRVGTKKRGRKIKTEIEDPELCPIPHRKSDRRRVARDIFIVFEEHPANRRRGKGGKTKPQKSKPKSKFAHLMADTKKQKKSATSAAVASVKIKSEPKTAATTTRKTNASTPAATVTSATTNPAPSTTVARVNPIFLWVKQDDTRIVEVRCEDYDKRNRIRLTKTANGWRAIPRTDPTTSRFAKLFPNPVVKIKQERLEEALHNSTVPVMQETSLSPPPDLPSPTPTPPPAISPEAEVMPTAEQPIKPLKIPQTPQSHREAMKSATSHTAKKKKKKKKKKKRKHIDEESYARPLEPSKQEPEDELDDLPTIVDENPIISTEPNHLVYESTNHEREYVTDQVDEDEEAEEEETGGEEDGCSEEALQIAKDPEPELEYENEENADDEKSDIVQQMEPNNNEPTEELSKNLTQISDDLELDNIPQFMHEVNPGTMQLCPETGLFIQKTMQVDEEPEHDQDLQQDVHQENGHHDHHDHHNHHHDRHDHHNHHDHRHGHHSDHHDDHANPVVLSDSFDGSDVDTKNLKDLLDDEYLLQHCSDNAMSGAELIDSLVKRGCEDNHISGDEPPIKETICLDDFENEDDDVLLQPEPVADIISRLGGSLTASPKCLSFNEAGEIEGVHGELFQTSTQNDPFNRHALEELSITIKDLEKSTVETYDSPAKQKSAESVTIVSPDSCVDEMPKDLTCKKSVVTEKEKPPTTLLERPNSRSSDAIQSPQPSGLPAVPPSPDLVHSKLKNVFLEQLLNSSNSISPKICSSVTVTPIKIPNAPAKQQKEPLDLGKHRKSASPTVSCSEEAKRVQTVTIDDDTPDEPLQKRIKREESEDEPVEKTHTENLIEMLSSGKDPDALTQLRLLIRNPEWKVPDPILVPKDRLSAVLASPAREIPLLLTTRPELRLPEAFAYPAILQDPDILVISMAQLETILQKQLEMTRPKAKTPPIPQVTIEAIPNPAKTRASEKPICAPSPDITVSSKKSTPSSTLQQPPNKNFINPLMGDIDAATLAAFNQMLWLPYLGQMAPDFIKAMAGLQNANSLAELLPLLQQQQNAVQQQHTTHQQQNQKSAFPTPQFNPMVAAAAAAAGLTNPMTAAAAFQNPLELAMWQEALTQAQMQRMLKLNAAAALAAQQQQHHQQRESVKKSSTADMKASASRNHCNSTMKQSTVNPPPPPYHHAPQSSVSSLSQSNQREKYTSSSTRSVPNPFYRPPAAGSTESSSITHRAKQKTQQSQQQQQEQKPRVTCKSLSNLLQPERLTDAKLSNLMAMPGFDFGFNGATAASSAAANPFQFASAAAAAAAAASAGRSSGTVGQYNSGNVNGPGTGVGSAGGGGGSALHRNNHTTSNIQHQQHQHQQQQHHHHASHHLQHQQLQHQQQHHQHQQQQQQSKLKVKPGSHLIDPAALQRRLLNCEDMSEVGSTTNGLEEMMADPNAALWHPLFGNTQKTGYNSPWQWTTVTASGE